MKQLNKTVITWSHIGAKSEKEPCQCFREHIANHANATVTDAGSVTLVKPLNIVTHFMKQVTHSHTRSGSSPINNLTGPHQPNFSHS